jgi:hypothetical protein
MKSDEWDREVELDPELEDAARDLRAFFEVFVLLDEYRRRVEAREEFRKKIRARKGVSRA